MNRISHKSHRLIKKDPSSITLLDCLIAIAIIGVVIAIFVYGLPFHNHTIEIVNLPTEHTNTIEATITGYSSTPDQTDSTPFLTAYNTKVRKGIVANNCLKRGTQVIIEGNTLIVEDRKNSRYGCEWFDIWFESREEALEWGIKEITIIIYN